MSAVPDYVQSLLDRLGGYRETSDGGWLARCPCGDHGADGDDRHESLRVAVGDVGQVLLFCRVGCSTVNVLTDLGLTFADLRPSSGEFAAPTSAPLSAVLSCDDARLRDRVYSTLLAQLVLEPGHADDLRRRGLSLEAIVRRRYRSLREHAKADIVAKLLDAFSASDLRQVPGFRDVESSIGLATGAGLVIPVLDVIGRIVALKLRTAGAPKYVYLSGDASPGSPPHCPLPSPLEYGVLRITEGELKADVCCELSGVYTVGAPGVASWRTVMAAVEYLGPRKVLVAFDWPDVLTKPPVRDCAAALCAELARRGCAVRVERWAPHKGIDDHLAAGGIPEEISPAVAFAAAPAAVHVASISEPESVALPAWSPAPFPVDVFPPPVADYLNAVAAEKQCPVDFAAVPALVVVGAAAGATRCLKLRGGWREKPSLYAVVVAKPGARKTPVMSTVLSPVFRLQELRHSEYKSAKKEWQQRRNSPGDAGLAPMLEHLYVSDVTVERLSSILSRTPRGLLYYRDELAGWVLSFDQYRGGKGADRQFFLSLWSGGQVKTDRQANADAPVFVGHGFVSVLGSIQPAMVPHLRDARARDDGFVDRLLFSYPADVGPQFWSDVEVPEELTEAWAAVVGRLYTLQPRIVSDAPAPVHVPFTDAGRSVFRDLYNAHVSEQSGGSAVERFAGSYSKFEAYAARFALVLALVRCYAETEPGEAPPEQVDACDVVGAGRLLAYFKNHLEGVFGVLDAGPDATKVESLVTWMRDSGKTSYTVREVQRSRSYRRKSDVLKLLRQAEDMGYGRLERMRTAGRVSEVFVVANREMAS